MIHKNILWSQLSNNYDYIMPFSLHLCSSTGQCFPTRTPQGATLSICNYATCDEGWVDVASQAIKVMNQCLMNSKQYIYSFCFRLRIFYVGIVASLLPLKAFIVVCIFTSGTTSKTSNHQTMLNLTSKTIGFAWHHNMAQNKTQKF